MNIANKGSFLREGLQDNGRQIYDLNIKDDTPLDIALKSLPAAIDLVIWEFYGVSSEPRHLSRCEPHVAAYCIGTPLNEFWLTPSMKNMDYVFVDQPQCVSSMAKNEI